MTDREIMEKLRSIVSRYDRDGHASRPLESLTGKTRLLEELGFNSLALLGILMDVEEVFGIQFPPEVFPSLRTADDVILEIRRVQAKAAAIHEGDGAFFRRESRIPAEVLDALPRFQTVCALLEYCGEQYAPRIAVSTPERRISYAEMLRRVRANCALLRAKGFAEVDHIAVYSHNDPDAALWMLSVMAFGGVVVLLPSVIPAQAAAGVCARFDVRGVAASEALAAQLRALSFALPTWPVTETGDSAGEFSHPAPEQAAAIILTSGTTGDSKGVVLSHKALATGAYYGLLYPNPRTGNPSDRRYLTAIPMTHIFGLEMGFLSFLYVGGEVCICPDPMSAIRNMHQVRPTVIILVPGLVELLLSLADARGKEFLGGLETIICGGAPIPPELYQRAAEYGIEMFGGYGMTEGVGLTSGGAGLASGGVGQTQLGSSAGKIYPGVRVKLVDGELWFAGDITMSGYYRDEEETRRTLVDGWVRSGDIGAVDEDGFVHIRGRVKNLIVLSNGENVSPEELETLLYRDPLVKECVVREMESGGTPVIGAEIYPNPARAGTSPEERSAAEAAIRQHVEALNLSLPTFKRIARVVICEEPLSKGGKPSKRKYG